MFQSLAMVGQFAVPILCMAAAAVSVVKRQLRSSLVAGVVRSRAPDALDGMSWQDFELLVGEAFRLQGYEVSELGGEGPDGGVDLVLRKNREKFLVQCKQWKAFKVGVAVVRELYGGHGGQGRGRRLRRHLGELHGGGDRVRERAQRHAGRRPEVVWADPAGEGCSRRSGEGRSSPRAAAARAVCSACIRRRGGDHLPDLLGLDGAPGRQAGRQGRQRLLGLFELSVLQRHALDRCLRRKASQALHHRRSAQASTSGCRRKAPRMGSQPGCG